MNTSNLAVDASFFSGKLTLTAELFDRTTVDIHQQVALPLTVGTDNPVFNIGSARNRGLELDLGYNGNAGDFTYGISGNVTFIKNEVLELYNDIPLGLEGNRRVEVGKPIGFLYGYQVGGMFKTQEEIDNHYANYPDNTIGGNSEYVRPGDLYFYDVHGNPNLEEGQRFYSLNPDGVVNDNDRTNIGNVIPGMVYGLNLNAGWKGLDLTVNFYGEGNVDKYNSMRNAMENMSSGAVNQFTSVRDRYTETNTNTDIPRAVAGDPAGNNRFSDRWVEGAGFFRLNTWQLGYSLPATILGKTNNIVNRFRLYVGGQNNMLITNWQGIDPVNDVYPLPKSYFVGLNATF